MATEVEHFARNTQSRLMEIPIGDIVPSGLNPRKHFPAEALEELAASIREHGLIEPIVVREIHPATVHERLFTLIAGERRWRAAQLAGLETLPAVVRNEPDDETAIRLMLIENLHREDLDPIEEAEGYRALANLGVKQSEIAVAINRSQPSVANALRLLELPDPVRELVQTGKLSAAHGRALLKYGKRPKVCIALAEIVVEHGIGSKRLEKPVGDFEGVSMDYLRTAGVVVEIDYQIRDQLKPEHGVEIWKSDHYVAYTPDLEAYATAVKQFRADAEKELQRTVQKARDAAAAKGEKIIKLEKLPYDSYTRLTRYDGRIDAPAGCPDDCYCRSVGQDRDGTMVAISTDPKHIEKLKRTQEREASKARKADAKDLEAQLDTLLEHAPALDRNGLAVVAADLIWQFKKPVGKRVIESFCAGVIKPEERDDYNHRRNTYKELATLPIENLLKILVHGTLLDDMRAHYEYGSISGRLGWYMEASGGDPFLDADLPTLRARLKDARTMADDTMHLPGEQIRWQDTVRTLEARIAEMKAGNAATVAGARPVTPAQAEEITAQTEADPLCPRCDGPAEILESGSEDAVWACSNLACGWVDGMCTDIVHVEDPVDDLEYSPEVRAKLAEIEQSKAAIAAERMS
jgi:ParB/RepB/Spo0J family partition protein